MKIKVVMFAIIYCISVSIIGCGSNKEVNKLNQQITELTTENENLKKQLAQNILSSVGIKTDNNNSNNITSEPTDEKMEYINNYLVINSATVKMYEGYSGKEPGISDISIKNNGEKNIDELIITVYFQDESGKDVAEDSFLAIGGIFGGSTLKANYSWKLESGKYIAFKNLSEEIDIEKHRVEISSIEFE